MRILTSLLWLTGAVWAAEIPLLSPLPVIDGRPEDVGWERATRMKINGKEATARFGRSPDMMYVCVLSEHGNLAYKKAEVMAHDDTVYADDNVDVFIDASGAKRDFYQVIANVRGTIFDHYKDELGRAHLNWDSGARAAGAYLGDSFYIELAIPWASMNFGRNATGEFGFTIGSYTRYNLQGRCLFGEYHQPGTWGRFAVPGLFPVVLEQWYSRGVAGRQPFEFTLRNVTGRPLVLAGTFNEQPVTAYLAPREVTTLNFHTRQVAGVNICNRLVLRERGQTVLRFQRSIIPGALLQVTPRSDILYRGDKLLLSVVINEEPDADFTVGRATIRPDRSAFTLQVPVTDTTPVVCVYKDQKITIPVEIISAPWP